MKQFLQSKIKEYRGRTKELGPEDDRGFGKLLGGVFTLIAVWAFIQGSGSAYVFLCLSAAFFMSAFMAAPVLRPLHKGWLALGLFLETFLSPLIMFVVYAVGFVPFALFFKLMGRDVLSLRKDMTKASYWCRRDFSPKAEDFKQQF